METYKLEYYKGEVTGITYPTSTEEYVSAYDNSKIHPNYLVKFNDNKGEVRTTELYSDGSNYKIGDKIYVNNTIASNDSYLLMGGKIRDLEIYGSILFFVIVVLAIFGWKGFKAIFSLIISITVIFYLLIPGILNGYNPVLISGFLATLLLTIGMLVTHGRNRVTYSAILGCSISISVTVLLSYFIVIFSRIDESSYYIENGILNNGSHINLSFLIVASIIIGVIGAVDDGAITQAKIVEEIKNLSRKLSPYQYYKRAMSIGRDHGGAMINTLVLAYVAGSIPDLLFLYNSTVPLHILVSYEKVSTEIFRAVISSVGLLLAIPLTTFFAVKLVKPDENNTNQVHSHSHFH